MDPLSQLQNILDNEVLSDAEIAIIKSILLLASQLEALNQLQQTAQV
jgi:hypothetical protein